MKRFALVLLLLAAGCVDEVPTDQTGSDPLRVFVLRASYLDDPGIESGLDSVLAAYETRGEQTEVHLLPAQAEFGDPSLRASLRLWLQDLVGREGVASATLIGEIPPFHFDGTNGDRIATDWPYRCPFAELVDGNADGAFEAMEGDVRAVIPVGRVYANSGLVPGAPPERVQLAAYLHRYAAYLRGETYSAGALNFLDSAFGWESGIEPPLHLDELYGPSEITKAIDPTCTEDVTTPDAYWDLADSPDVWDLIHLYAHGSGAAQYFYRLAPNDFGTCTPERLSGLDYQIQSSDHWRDENTIRARTVFQSSCGVCGLARWFDFDPAPVPMGDPLCSAVLHAHPEVLGVVSASISTDYGGENFEVLFTALAHGLNYGAAMNAAWNATASPGEFDYREEQLLSYNLIGDPNVRSTAGGHRTFNASGGYVQRAGATDTADGLLPAFYGISADASSGLVMVWDRTEGVDEFVKQFEFEVEFFFASGDSFVREYTFDVESLGRSAGDWAIYVTDTRLAMTAYDSALFRVKPLFQDGSNGHAGSTCTLRIGSADCD